MKKISLIFCLIFLALNLGAIGLVFSHEYDRYDCETTTAKAVNATTQWVDDECLITGPAK